MTPMRVLLVDDEHLACDRLRRLLGAHDDIEVIGEAHDGEQALDRIQQLEPDLVLLDIEMPGCNGMEVAASLPAPRPRIVFCTAFDEYAVEAFELHAVDYLLKPVTRARLDAALERVRRLPTDSLDRSIDRIAAASGSYPRRFLAKRGSRHCVVPRNDVLYFASEGGLTRLQTREDHHWMQPTLAELDDRLDPAGFFRISRAAIVNLDAVREVLPLPGGHAEVRLTDDTRLEVSRRRVKPLIERLAR
jgi:two-component system LytT family response regulator